MNKGIVFIILAGVLVTSCTMNGDKQAQLQKLLTEKQQYEEKIKGLDEAIATLEDAIREEGGTVAVQVRPINISVDTVRQGMFKHFIEIQGMVESDKNIFVPAESPGVVTRIYVKEGDHVKKGQVMAEVDATILESSLEEVRINLDLANDMYERQKRLWDQKIGSEMQYLQAKNARDNLEKRMATLQEQYEKTRIKSPINGVVDQVVIREGEAAIAGFGAIRVVQTSNLKIKANVSEKYIRDIKAGDTALMKIPQLDLEFAQKLKAVSNVINMDNRTFTIEAAVPQEYQNIANNMLAVIKVNDYSNENALTVPLNIVQNSGEYEFLFVAVNDNGTWKAQKRIVKTGRNFDNRVEILENLQPGETIVTVGFQDLADGQVVTIIE